MAVVKSGGARLYTAGLLARMLRQRFGRNFCGRGLHRSVGEIVGFIGLNKGHIEGIFVDGDHRSKGVGKSLIDFAKELYPKLSLCVYEKNERAVDFYRREGFWPVRKKPDISTGETEILMRWEVKRIQYNL